MKLKGGKVLVVGTGISGIGAAGLLEREGACPILYDERDSINIEEIRKKLEVNGQDASLPVIAGALSDEAVQDLALAVVSPGVPADSPLVRRLQDAGVEVWGEIELAYTFSEGQVIGITGTNGKTTTTSLVGRIMEGYFPSVYVVGNIGSPYTAVADQTGPRSVTVAEISSFQLETVHKFRPQVSAILNITPDHLDRHHTMENYAAVKEAITANQTSEQVCVLNYDNAYTREFGEHCPARVVYFSSGNHLEDGICLEGDTICRMSGGVGEALLSIHEMKLAGMCNVENVMAAIAISMNMCVPMEHILRTVREFQAVEHRIEFVAAKRGVDYYNDSKGTNPDAAIQGIKAMTRPTWLIGGGYDKGSAYEEWVESFAGKVKCLVLIGQTREKIAACAKSHGIESIVLADSLEEAFRICAEGACEGEAVLLSPACASWGMFPNYEVRGNLFKEYVNRLEE